MILRISDRDDNVLTEDDLGDEFTSIAHSLSDGSFYVNGKLLAYSDGVNPGLWITVKGKDAPTLMDVGSIEVVR